MAGKSIAPLLLLGGAAVILAGGKRKSRPSLAPDLPDDLPPPPPPPKGSSPKAEPGETHLPIQLAYLGYDLKGGEDTVEAFQGDYNVVMMLQTAGKAKTFGVLLDEDGVIGPRTKDAIVTAIDIQNDHGPWPEFVKKAAQQYGEA